VFTGIIQAVGQVGAVEKRGGDCRFQIHLGALADQPRQIGDSIAVNGVCLTAVEFTDSGADSGLSMFADVSSETLACTTLAELAAGDDVNLEMALTPTTRLGGHLVSGHVDGIAEVVSRHADARSERIEFRAPKALARYIAAKGSVCIDGVSLTVNTVADDTFGVNIVPHTIEHTNLGRCQPGVRVNLEIDVIARYLERLLTAGFADGERNVSEIILAQASSLLDNSTQTG
jgi:riboflavin synthase